MARFVLVPLLVAACALTSLTASAASWFVDNAAVGANNGTSWANAWNSFAAINWTSVQPGDTIFVSGGSTTKTYGSQMTIAKNGTAANRITITKGTDAGHNGQPIIQGNYVEGSNRSYITLKDLWYTDFFNTNVATFANSLMFPSSTGIKLDHVTFSNVNNCVNFSSSTGFWMTNCFAYQTRGDAVVRASGAYGSGYEGNIIENCDFEVAVNDQIQDGGGPDGIQTGNNITSRNNIFRVRRVTDIRCSNQHPDMFQAPGVFLAIYNNEFINVGDSCIALGAWWDGSVHSNIKIYNNIFRIVSNIDPYPEYIRLYSGTAGGLGDISNVLIANNLFIDNPSWINVNFTQYRADGGGNPTGSNNYLVNNIWYNSGGGGCWNLNWSSQWNASTWTVKNNIYYPAGSSFIRWSNTTYSASSWIAGTFEIGGSTSQPLFASYTPNGANNNLHLSGSDTAARDTGVNLSTFFTIDKDNLTRTVPWDRGAYEYPSSGQSILTAAEASYTVAESAGTVTLTFRRTGTVSGTVGCTWTTANGTASSGVNYTGGSGLLSWGNNDGADKTVAITLLDTDMLETKTFTVTLSAPTGGAVIGGQNVSTVSITGTGTPSTPLLSGYGPWPATDGQFAAPFATPGGNVLRQTVTTDDPAAGGRATYTFTNSAGQFRVIMEVDAPSGSANSFFADMNTEPTSDLQCYDVVVLTSGFEDRYVSIRGTGTFETPQYSPKVWDLAAGTNTFIVRGREANTLFRNVTLDPVIPEPPGDPIIPTVVSVTSTNLPGAYRTNVVIPINVAFSTNVTVTGTPRILMNTGGFANYASGSTSTNLVFNYAIGASQNTQLLDYDSINALTLNGGTIKNDTNDATLTLPTPGLAGSLSFSVQIVVDTTKPTISVSAPLVTATNVTFQVTYTDLNYLGNILNVTNLTMITTGTLTGTVDATGGGTGSAAILVSNLSGNGNLTVNIAAGTGIDLAGNVSDASSTGTYPVVSMTISIISNAIIRNAVIGRTQ